MFLSTNLKKINPQSREHEILSIICGGEPQFERIIPGVYKCNHFNFHSVLDASGVSFDEYSTEFSINPYGVCDSPEQFLSDFGQEIAESPNYYIVAFTQLLKSEQPPQGGWRWHKWGPYVGHQSPQAEYLYDEPKIDEVYVYNIYQITDSPVEEE